MLTKKECKEYIDKMGCHCPYCDSSDIIGEGVEIEANEAYQQMFCNVCDRGWTDEYKLVRIIEEKD